MSSHASSPRPERPRIGVCLSGGGFRATLFHLGSLRRLNEVGLLANVTTFSSVSGGSILNAFLARVWPQLQAAGFDPSAFERLVEAPVLNFCSRDIRTGPLLWKRLWPGNWLRLLGGQSATNLLADTYSRDLLSDLTPRCCSRSWPSGLWSTP